MPVTEKPLKAPFWRNLRFTRIKMSLARCVYLVITIFMKQKVRTIQRQGITYEVDLEEGIDFSVFLFGSFQKFIWNNPYCTFPEKSVLFDIGANIGTVALPLAKTYQQAKIIAIEPTDFAFQKLSRNIELNPELAKRIQLEQAFVTEKSSQPQTIMAYASWNISKNDSRKHPIHGGIEKESKEVLVTSLDDYCREHGIAKVDFIKVDTEGHDFKVLQGAAGILKESRPVVIFEIGQYFLVEQKITFDEIFNFFMNLNYTLVDLKTDLPVTLENYKSIIPLQATTDLVGVPKRIKIYDGRVRNPSLVIILRQTEPRDKRLPMATAAAIIKRTTI